MSPLTFLCPSGSCFHRTFDNAFLVDPYLTVEVIHACDYLIVGMLFGGCIFEIVSTKWQFFSQKKW